MGISAVHIYLLFSLNFPFCPDNPETTLENKIIKSEKKVGNSCSEKVLCTFNIQHVLHYFFTFYNHKIQVISSLLEEEIFWASCLIYVSLLFLYIMYFPLNCLLKVKKSMLSQNCEFHLPTATYKVCQAKFNSDISRCCQLHMYSSIHFHLYRCIKKELPYLFKTK